MSDDFAAKAGIIADKVCRIIYKKIDRVEGDDDEKATVVMAVIGLLVGSSYLKVVREANPETGDDWLGRAFQIAQHVISVNGGPKVKFSFVREEE